LRSHFSTKVFTRVIRDALHNDYLSHAIKVFDKSSKAASFWYLYRTNRCPIDNYAKQVGYEIGNLQIVTDKLKAIRNGSHFHIDKRGVLDPKAIWTGAALTGKELGAAIDFVWEALRTIQEEKGGEVPSLLNYTPDIAKAAIERVESGTP
jgi:hypothetical protein